MIAYHVLASSLWKPGFLGFGFFFFLIWGSPEPEASGARTPRSAGGSVGRHGGNSEWFAWTLLRGAAAVSSPESL